MKTKGFTLMEVMLSIILFALMVGAILGSYNSIQRASIKTANTQDAIQAAEDFLERINDTSLEYQIDTGKYSSDEKIGHWEMIKTGTLYLINKNNGQETLFYRGCNGTKCSLFMSRDGTEINLVDDDKVNVTNLKFTIYPNDQYVNTDITAKVEGGESLYKSGITLSTTVGFKDYEIYEGQITPEQLCEDVCSISQVNADSVLHTDYSNNSSFDNNTTLNSCTLKYGAGLSENFFSYAREAIQIMLGMQGDSVYKVAKDCTLGLNKKWCDIHCRETNIGNPYNCGFIRYQIHNGLFTGATCEEYNAYSKDEVCQSMCLASIFTCIDDTEDSLVRRTGIKIKTGEYGGKYLQNPRKYEVEDVGTYKAGNRVGSNGWVGCNTYREYRAKSVLDIINDDCEVWDGDGKTYCSYLDNNGHYGGGIDTPPTYRRCINGAYHCDGTHYGNSFDTGIILLTTGEYEQGCIKWTQNGNATNQYTSKRIIYTPEIDTGNILGDCVCEVDYQYSLFAGGFIENGTYVGQKHLDRGIGETLSESLYEYLPRPYDLIYVEEYNPGDSWPLDGVKNRVGLSDYLDTTKCKNNELCAKNQSYQGYTEYFRDKYNLTTTGGFYQMDTNINYNSLKCSNTGFYSCLSSGCCEAPGVVEDIYETEIDYPANSVLKSGYCTQYLTGSDGNHGIWNGSQCTIADGCMLWQSGYNQVNINTGYALQNFCIRNHHQWLNNECKEYMGFGCTTWAGLTIDENDIKKYFCEQSGFIRDTSTRSCKRFTGIGCLPNTILSFTTGASFPYYCTNYYQGYERNNVNGIDGCRKCTSTYTGYEEYLSNVSRPTDNSLKENYCTNKLNYTWRSNKCCKSYSILGGCKNETGINLDIAKQYYCGGQNGYISGGNCLRPAYYDWDYDATMGNYCENYLNHYWWSITDKCCANSPLLLLICGTEYSISNENTARPYYCSSNFSNINIPYLWSGSNCRKPISVSCTSYHTQSINGDNANPYYCKNKLGKIRDNGKCCSQTGELYTGVNITISNAQRQFYCTGVLHSVRSGNQCLKCSASGDIYEPITIDTGEALQDYCTNILTGVNNTPGKRSGDNKCYLYTGDFCAQRNYTPITIDIASGKWFYCTQSTYGNWIGNKCYDMRKKTSECIIQRANEATCPDDGNREYRDNECTYVLYRGCAENGQWKNIYKDYTYTCDMAIAQQSDNIANIIETIENSAQSPSGNAWDIIQSNRCKLSRWDLRGC